jgi:TRAP-type mannitol/chloroaromatic compound transport system permease large subunit
MRQALGVAPPGVTTRHIYLGVIPFVVLQILNIVLVFFLAGNCNLAAQGHRLVRRTASSVGGRCY